MNDSIRIEHDVHMEMRDGTLLAGEVYRPGDGRKCPVIIMRTPYHSDSITGGSAYLKLMPAVQAGYAVVIAYLRGRFGSQGKYELGASQQAEGADCYDTVEWAA